MRKLLAFVVVLFLMFGCRTGIYTYKTVSMCKGRILKYPVLKIIRDSFMNVPGYECYGEPCGPIEECRCSICGAKFILQPFSSSECPDHPETYLYFTYHQCFDGKGYRTRHRIGDEASDTVGSVSPISKCTFFPMEVVRNRTKH